MKRTACALVLALVLGSHGNASGIDATEKGCFQYHDPPVPLRGSVVSKTLPGPPNYESIETGDEPETYWYLQLSRRICVDEIPKDPYHPAQKDVLEIQLLLDGEDYARYRALLGVPIVARGKLCHGFNGHHHTWVLMESVKLEAAAKGSSD
jgi:GAF domain-containing protein